MNLFVIDHFDGNSRTITRLFKPLSIRKIVWNISGCEHICLHVRTEKLLEEKKNEVKLFYFFFFLTKPKEAEPNTRFEGWPQIVSCNENWEERNNPKSVRTKFDLNKAVRSFSTSKKQSTFPYFLFHLKNPLSLRICKKLPRDY